MRSKICQAARTTGAASVAHTATRHFLPYRNRIGIRNMAWYAASAANPIAIIDAASHPDERRSTAWTYSAIASSQKAVKGKSDSSELPLTTNAGVAMNSIVAASGCGLNFRAKASALNDAINENKM